MASIEQLSETVAQPGRDRTAPGAIHPPGPGDRFECCNMAGFRSSRVFTAIRPIMLQPQQQDLSGSETDEEAAHVDQLRTQPTADTTEEAAAGIKRCFSVCPSAHVL